MAVHLAVRSVIMCIMMTIHPLVHVYYDILLGFPPQSYARMNPPGSERKYTKIHSRPGLSLIQAHLRGEVTIAVPLLNDKGEARAAVLDIDEGGQGGLTSLLEWAGTSGLVAFAVTSTNEKHDGGHVWILFEHFTDPRRLRQLAGQLAERARVTAETYPTRKAIRLPFGVHTWTGRRGRLILPSGEVLNLDNGPEAVIDAVKCLRSLPLNRLSSLPPDLETTPRNLRESPSDARREVRTVDPISDYNQSTNLLHLIVSRGGRIAESYRDGSYLVQCPCGFHKHGDETPSLLIQPAKNRTRYGQYIAVGYSPSCLFYTERGQVVDAFSAYCKLEHVNPREALKKVLNR